MCPKTAVMVMRAPWTVAAPAAASTRPSTAATITLARPTAATRQRAARTLASLVTTATLAPPTVAIRRPVARRRPTRPAVVRAAAVRAAWVGPAEPAAPAETVGPVVP